MVSRNLELETEDFCSVDSANIFPGGLGKAGGADRKKRSRDYQGIAVIHGTDTLAYTASMLSFMLQNISIPVAVQEVSCPQQFCWQTLWKTAAAGFIWRLAAVREYLWHLTVRSCRGCRASKGSDHEF